MNVERCSQGPSNGQSNRRPALHAPILLLLWVSLAACSFPGGPAGLAQADWRGMAPSWEKLDLLERWLDEEGPTAPPEERIEAELQLAEGRLEFAAADLERDDRAPVQGRLEAAAASFDRILGDLDSSADQRQRARDGRDIVDGMARPRAIAASGSLRVFPRSTWGARAARANNMRRASQSWSIITVHHTAMPSRSLQGASVANTAGALQKFQEQHMDVNGWADIGYHYLIDPNGRIFEGRRLKWQGAHAGGSSSSGHNNNVDNIGICLLGDFAGERPTGEALRALTALMDELRTRYGIPRKEVYGHKDFKNTVCPGPNLMAFVTRYKNGLAMSSSNSSSDLAARQPSASSRVASPTIRKGSSSRVR